MITTEMKAKGGKCLALVAVLAMVVCAFAIALPAGETEGAVASALPGVVEGKVTLTEDVTLTSNLEIATSETIDLNGKTLTVTSILVLGGATLTITDSSEGKTGSVVKNDTIDGNTSSAINVGYGGKMAVSADVKTGCLIVDGAKIVSTGENGGYGVGVWTGSSATFNNATVEAKYCAVAGNGTQSNAVIDINGGTYSSTETVAVFFPSTETLTIDDATLKGVGGIDVRAGTVTVNNTNIVISRTATGVGSSGPAGFNVGIGVYQWNGTSYGTPDVTVSGVTVTGSKTCDIYYGILNASKDAFDDATSTTDVKSVRTGSALTINDASGALFTIDNQATSAASSVMINLDGSKMVVKSGSVFNCDLAVKANKMSFEAMTATTDLTVSEGSIAIEGDFTVAADGSITVTGSAKITGDVTIPAGATLSVLPGANLTGNGKIINSGSVDIAGSTDIEIENNNADASVIIQPGSTVDTTKITGSGTVSGGSNWEIVEISGVLKAEFEGDVNQTVIVTGDLEIRSNMTINGKLIINEGATVTIATAGAGITFGALATAEINGDLVLEVANAFAFSGTSMTVNGNIDAQAENALTISKTTTVNGSVNISEDGSAALSETTVSTTGSITVNGKVTGTIVDFGTVTIDSDKTDLALTVQVRNAAIVSIAKTAGSVTVTDDGMTYKTGGVDTNMTHNNTIVFAKVSGVSVTEKMVVVNNAGGTRSAYGVMTVDGNIDAIKDDAGEYVSDAKVETKTGILTAGDMTIGKVGFVVDAGATFSIGTAVVFNKENSTITGNGTVTITGTLATVTSIADTLTINAASYVAKVENVDYNYYTTFETAVESGSTAITTYGSIEVSKTIDVPAGVVITMTDNSSMTIKEDVTLRLVDGAKFKTANKTIDVKGTLVVENFPKSNATGTINSDVEKKSDTDKVYTMTYTNIYNALETAVDGEIVKLKADGVKIEKNITVPAGVTFQIDKTLELKAATMTVEGKVVVESTFTISDDGVKKGAVIVNGLFQYKTGTYSDKIAGAYFAYGGVDTIAPIAFAAENIDAIDSDVTLYLVNETTDVTFNYTGTSVVNLKVLGTLKAGTVTLKNVIFDATGATDVTATIALTNGSVTLTDVTGVKFEDKVTYDADNNPIYTANFSGTVAKCNDTKVKNGAVSFNGEVIAAGSVGEKVNVTVPAGITLTANAFDVDTLVVEGTFHAASDSTVATATVFGSMTTADGKKITVTTLYLGIDASKIIKTTGAAASASDAVELGTNGTAFVAPGCDAGKKITAYGKTEFYVEGSVYITAYVNGTSSVEINKVKATVDNAEFKSWQVDGTDVPTGTMVGTTGYAKVEAKLDYNICEIKVTSVPGVIVYIDGEKFSTTTNMYIVGSHTVEVYLQSGYSGTPVVKVNGSEISGKTFTTSAGEVTTIVVSGVAAYQPSTVEPEKDDGMGLTDILLIVLVVLIAIMAIMVALRMMRS